jgi:hypothetical protein
MEVRGCGDELCLTDKYWVREWEGQLLAGVLFTCSSICPAFSSARGGVHGDSEALHKCGPANQIEESQGLSMDDWYI